MRFSSLEPRGQKNLQPYEDQLSKTNSLMKQAGSGPSRRHIQGSKLAKSKKTSKCQVFSFTALENRKFFEKITYSKKWTEWRAGGTLPKLSTFSSLLKGGPFGEKTNFRKKSHKAEKLKAETLWDFKHPICCIISMKLKEGDPLERKKFKEKKVSQCRKTERGDPLGFFNIHSVAKHQQFEGGKFLFSEKSLTVPKKTVRGDPLGFSNIDSDAKQQKKLKGDPLGNFFFEKKSQCRNKMKEGTLWSRHYGMLRGKTGKTFLVQFDRPNSAIWCNNIL